MAYEPLFIDAEALVIDKPAGLDVTRPRRGGESLDDYRPDLAFGFHHWPTIVHRLDKDTSGCLLLARTVKSHRRYQQAFELGQVQKTYIAILDGVPADESGTVDMALSKYSTAEEGWRIIPDPNGKSAKSHWRVVEVIDGRALVEFSPETGRTHQLRVHAASGIGVPICGDPVYGGGQGLMLLHASELIVPRDGKPPIAATAPMPHRFRALGFGAGDGDAV
jgi:tRNA pseudouridine32 synthase / 23S rRNA pseudouridine746 synthase